MFIVVDNFKNGGQLRTFFKDYLEALELIETAPKFTEISSSYIYDEKRLEKRNFPLASFTRFGNMIRPIMDLKDPAL